MTGFDIGGERKGQLAEGVCLELGPGDLCNCCDSCERHCNCDLCRQPRECDGPDCYDCEREAEAATKATGDN